MTYRPRRTCKRCGQDRDDVGGVSRRGNCAPCGQAAMTGAIAQLAGHYGPVYETWMSHLADALARLYGEAVPDYPPDQHISAGSGHDPRPATLALEQVPARP